jgi:nitric oxide reductase NorD protein
LAFPTYESELQPFPGEYAAAFREAQEAINGALTEEEFRSWADCGLRMAKRAGRSWQASREYFIASPALIHSLPFTYFMEWGYWGSVLSEESPIIAETYFKVASQVVPSLKPWEVAEWAKIGRGLYTGSRQSSALCARFFEASGDMLKVLSLSEFQHLMVLVQTVGEKSANEAIAFLSLSQEVLPSLREDTRACLSLVSTLVRDDWRQARGCLRIVRESLSRVERVERARFLNLAERISSGGVNADIPTFLQKGSASLGRIDEYLHIHILNLAQTLSGINPGVVLDFLQGVPQVLQRLSVKQLEDWYDQGVVILRENPEGGSAFFRSESARSKEVLEKLSTSVELGRIKEIMRMYCRALTALDVQIAVPEEETVSQAKGWVALEKAMTGESVVYLPPVAERFTNKEDNFDWYKVVTTHQVAHLEFDSSLFSFDTPAHLFPNLRPHLAQSVTPGSIPVDPDEEEEIQASRPTDLHRFFSLFKDVQMAHDIFTAAEDYRLDHRVKMEYPGIRKAYAKVQAQALEERPPIEEMPARKYMVEILIRLSLGHERDETVQERYPEGVKALREIVNPLALSQALVEDTAEATIRLYQIISQIPNYEATQQELENNDFQLRTEGLEEEGPDEMLRRLADSPISRESGEEQPYSSPPKVDYRGEFNPELAQLISRLIEMRKDQGAKGNPVSREDLERLLAGESPMDLLAEAGDLEHSGIFITEAMKTGNQMGTPDPSLRQVNLPYDPYLREEEEKGGPLESKEPRSFLYDEWDYRMADYRPRWCLLREKHLGEGDTSFFSTTMDNYATLVAQIRRQFELIVPQGLRKMKKMQDGDELDLDSVIEALMDKRAGSTPSDKVYSRRNKVQRDVGVVFLLDLSASTAEAIDESRRTADEWDAPDDPLEYMFWLRTRRGEEVRRSYKRIIDVEKESLVLLCHALETIGDTYGIYGFSGYGRENVDFYIIKDIKEGFSDKIKRRIDKASPLQATRMGPAIRHAVTKLEGIEARTKFFFLISDGRPQDRGYSREGVEKDYAIHDTKMALTEARQKGIIPFCLTVDKEGHDYLRAMCQDMGYEVLADIHSLPRRLPTLYRNLTR